jgi:hypothetical protein
MTSATSEEKRPRSAISEAKAWRASCGVTFGPPVSPAFSTALSQARSLRLPPRPPDPRRAVAARVPGAVGSSPAVRLPVDVTEGGADGFNYRLELRDGSAGDPPTFSSAVPTWRPGDSIFLGGGRTLRVVDMRTSAEPDGDPVLVVMEDAAEGDAA